jgi:hypothetical protein
MSSNLMLIPACITVSKAFFKSTKHANNLPSFELQYLLIRQKKIISAFQQEFIQILGQMDTSQQYIKAMLQRIQIITGE